MATNRQEKVARLLQRELSEIFQRSSAAEFKGQMITVTVVRISPDLAMARVYLSIFPTKDKEDLLARIKQRTSFIRGELGNRIKKSLRIVPELVFIMDDSIDYIENIDNLLKS
jgi:ribosome-binding factor A